MSDDPNANGGGDRKWGVADRQHPIPDNLRAMLASTDPDARLRNEVMILATMLGVAVGLADKPGSPHQSISAALTAVIDRMAAQGIVTDVATFVAAGLAEAIGEEPPPEKSLTARLEAWNRAA